MEELTGFDLDGILMPDFAKVIKTPLDRLLDMRYDFRPLFNPKGEWCIISGRPVDDKELVDEWVEKHFGGNPPINVVMSMTMDTFQDVELVSKYKSWWITMFELKTYFESSLTQTGMIRSYIKNGMMQRIIKPAMVIHWSSFIQNQIIEMENIT